MRIGVLLMAVTSLAAPPGASAVAQGPLPSANTAAVSGVVVDAGSGRPLEGAIVVLIRRGTAQVAPAQRMVTDAQGRFVFKDLPASSGYSLSATRFGYLPGDYGKSELSVSGGARPFVLAENQWLADARIALWRPGAVSGTVLDEHGDPVVGVYVRLIGIVQAAGNTHFAAGPATLTDDRGMYRIGGLHPGKYLVSVPSVQNAVPTNTTVRFAGGGPFLGPRAEREYDLVDVATGVRWALSRYPIPAPTRGGPRLAYRQTFYPNSTSTDTASPVELTAGNDLRGIDIRLEPVPTARVSGTIEGPREAANGLTLRLVPVGSEDLGDGSETATSLVGPDGLFLFVNVPAGAYTIEARAAVAQLEIASADPGMEALPSPPVTGGFGSNSSGVASSPAGTSIVSRTTGGDALFWGRTRVTVGGQDITGLTVTMQRTARMSGRVVWEGERPQMSFLVASLEPANGSASLGSPPRVPGQPVDTFSIGGIMPGEYVLRFNGSPWAVKSIAWDGRDKTDAPFDATEGRDFADVVVTFTPKAATVSGVVRDRNATPTNAAAVIAFPTERERWSGYGFTPIRIKLADAGTGGAFTLGGMPAGEYFVVAVDSRQSDAWQDPKFLERAVAVATRVSLAWGDTKSVDLVLAEVR